MQCVALRCSPPTLLYGTCPRRCVRVVRISLRVLGPRARGIELRPLGPDPSLRPKFASDASDAEHAKHAKQCKASAGPGGLSTDPFNSRVSGHSLAQGAARTSVRDWTARGVPRAGAAATVKRRARRYDTRGPGHGCVCWSSGWGAIWARRTYSRMGWRRRPDAWHEGAKGRRVGRKNQLPLPDARGSEV